MIAVIRLPSLARIASACRLWQQRRAIRAMKREIWNAENDIAARQGGLAELRGQLAIAEINRIDLERRHDLTA